MAMGWAAPTESRPRLPMLMAVAGLSLPEVVCRGRPMLIGWLPIGWSDVSLKRGKGVSRSESSRAESPKLLPILFQDSRLSFSLSAFLGRPVPVA